jgi:hypothetical protein
MATTNSNSSLKTIISKCKVVSGLKKKPANLTCPICNKTFANKSLLEDHIQDIYGKDLHGEFHDQVDAKWIIISGPLRGHNDIQRAANPQPAYRLPGCWPPLGVY